MGLTFISREEPLAGGAWIIMGGVVVIMKIWGLLLSLGKNLWLEVHGL